MTFNQRNSQLKGAAPIRNTGANAFLSNHLFNDQWITGGPDEKMIDFTEKAGKFMAENGLTNSKIRSIYGEIKRIQMGEFSKEKSSFFLLKPKVAYALGRDPRNEGLLLFKLMFDKCFHLVKEETTFKNYCNFLEAILAYHKANGGRD